MRIARVLGTVTLGRRREEFATGGRLLVAEALDSTALAALPAWTSRQRPMPESLVVFDRLGAGPGQMIAISEGREATMPFYPDRVPCDAYCAAILDDIDYDTRS